MSLYKSTSAVMYFGEMKFKQRPREDQAESDGTAGNLCSTPATQSASCSLLWALI